MSQENVEVVRAMFEANSAGAMDAFSELHAPDVNLSALDESDAAYLEAVADHLSPIWAPIRARRRRRRRPRS